MSGHQGGDYVCNKEVSRVTEEVEPIRTKKDTVVNSE